MTDNDIFEEVSKSFIDPKTLDLLRAGLADPNEIETVKRALRYGSSSMRQPLLRDTVYRIFDRLLNTVRDDETTRQLVRKDLRKLQKNTQEDRQMSKDINAANVDAAIKHDCAKHVVSEQWGRGQCIPGEHTLLDDGTVTHYDVMFEHGIECNVAVANLTILESMMHGHAPKKKKPMEEEAVTPEGGEDSSKASKKGKFEMPMQTLKAIMEKRKSESTKPKTPEEKKLAALAPPHDEITHGDVVTGRTGKSLKEFVVDLAKKIADKE